MPRFFFRELRVAFLIIESGPEQGRKVDLRGPLVVGRQAKVGLSIKDGKASREHTRFEPAAGSWAVVDLQSTNGTLLNGRKIEREFMQAGDRVTVGQTVFRFEDADPNPASTTSPMREPGASQPLGRGPAVPGGTMPVTHPTPPTMRPGPIPAALPASHATPPPSSPAAAAAAAGEAPVERGGAPKLRYQDKRSGPGFFTIVICTAILVGLVFAARWIGQRAIAKAIDERKQGQKTP